MSVGVGGVYIRRIYADNNDVGGGTEVDIDGDGNPDNGFGGLGGIPTLGTGNDASNSDEFMVITHDASDLDPTPLDIGGYELWSGGQIYHTFPAGTILNPGESIRVITHWSLPDGSRGVAPAGTHQANGGNAALDPQTQGGFTASTTRIPDNNSGTGTGSTPITGGEATVALFDGEVSSGSPTATEAFVVSWEAGGTPGIPVNTYGPTANNGVTTIAPGTIDAEGTGTFPAAGVLINIGLDGTVDPGPVCFTTGTLIDTPEGARKVEDLQVGDLVLTRDHGPQPIRWIGERTLSVAELRRKPNFWPVTFAEGFDGNSRPLTVSPQHRMLVTGWRAEMLFGEDGVLVPAKAFLDHELVQQSRPTEPVTYIHLFFDTHEVIRSEGLWTESLFPGDEAMKSLAPEAIAEFETLFGDLATVTEGRKAAHPMLSVGEGKVLATIH